MENKIIKDSAETMYISHPEASYGIFCYNTKGDLFLNSDYGFYGYAWRHYGDEEFKKFLSQCNAEYIVSKFSINHRDVSGKKMPPFKEQKLTILVNTFIEELKKDAA